MAKSYLFLADGFEEVEALTIVDIMRRASLDVVTVSINETREATGSHGITVVADTRIADLDTTAEAEWVIAPGGMPGASNIFACKPAAEMITRQAAAGRNVAAICAAPAVVLAPLGVLKGYEATCYPGFEQALTEGGARKMELPVVSDRNIVTGNGPAAAMELALAIVERSCGVEAARTVASGLLYNRDC